MELGQLIDELDSNILVEKINKINMKLVEVIEEKIKEISKKKLTAIEVIPFKYTEANYYGVLMRLAWCEYNKLKKHSKKFEKWKNYDDADLEIKVERIKLYREALDLYDSDSVVSPEYIAQVSTNLGNLYNEMGRIVESIEVLSETVSKTKSFPMALGNYAIKHHSLATYSIDESTNKYLLNLALEKLSEMLKDIKDTDLIVPEQIEVFERWKERIIYILDKEFEGIDTAEVSMDVDKPYKNWRAKNQLSLNYINIVQAVGNIDNLHIPNMGIGYFSEDEGNMTYYSWFNTIKQEFNMARYNIYLTEDLSCEIHESQYHNVLINTLDYPAIGYKTELLKTALKSAYSILDKIGLFCSHFFKVGTKAGSVSFDKWFEKVEKQVAVGSPFEALYWLSKDLDFKTGFFKDIRRLRNVIEHRYVRVLDYYEVPLSEELDDMNKYEYIIEYKDLYESTIKTLKLVRSAIFYMVNGFNIQYKTAVRKNSPEKIFIPLRLDIYEDEWKN